MRVRHALLAVCGATLLWGVGPMAPAFAGTLQVNPVLLEINAGRRTATVTLRNEEATPVTIRAYALDWRQTGGDEAYGETSAVIVSPPIFTVAPGATQLIRVGLRSPSAAPAAYRLIVEEVPEAQPSQGIRVALRLNLPLYASVDAGPFSALRWAAWREADGNWMLEATNGGQGYVRIDPAVAQNAIGVRIPDHVNLGTVLPGAVRRWRIGTQIEVSDTARFRTITRAQGHGEARASLD